MDITRSGVSDEARFLDDRGRGTVHEALRLLDEGVVPPHRGVVSAWSRNVIKDLLRIVHELHERLEMTESYVESATAARQEMPEVPGLSFEDLPLEEQLRVRRPTGTETLEEADERQRKFMAGIHVEEHKTYCEAGVRLGALCTCYRARLGAKE